MNKRTCETCRFWAQQPARDLQLPVWGLCRRFAPNIIIIHLTAPIDTTPHHPLSEWPGTRPDDWCGDYLARGQQ